MKSVIVDTSFLVSLTNPKEKHHAACADVARELTARLIVPVAVLPETTYLLASRLSHRTMRAFVHQLQDPQWIIENVSDVDLERATAVLDFYADAKLDFADATIVALAERLGLETILTLDRRDFQMIRPLHINQFTILP